MRKTEVPLIALAVIWAFGAFAGTAAASGGARYSDLVECMDLGDADRLVCFDQVANGLKEQAGASGQGAQTGKDLMVTLINGQIIEDRSDPGIDSFSLQDESAEPDPTDGSFNLNAERFADCMLEQNDAARMTCIDRVVRNAWPY